MRQLNGLASQFDACRVVDLKLRNERNEIMKKFTTSIILTFILVISFAIDLGFT